MQSDGDIRIKKYCIQTSDGQAVNPLIAEYFCESESIFTWNSALVLSTYVASRKLLFQNKRILEVGCGNGLVSITAALIGATNIIMTDRLKTQAPKMYELMEYNILLNQLKADQIQIVSASVVSLW